MPNTERIENIVVEIKHPLKKLTQAHYQQLRKYTDILTSVKEFVADNYKWTFFLVGTDIDQSLADDIENMKVKGKTGLIFEKTITMLKFTFVLGNLYLMNIELNTAVYMID